MGLLDVGFATVRDDEIGDVGVMLDDVGDSIMPPVDCCDEDVGEPGAVGEEPVDWTRELGGAFTRTFGFFWRAESWFVDTISCVVRCGEVRIPMDDDDDDDEEEDWFLELPVSYLGETALINDADDTSDDSGIDGICPVLCGILGVVAAAPPAAEDPNLTESGT